MSENKNSKLVELKDQIFELSVKELLELVNIFEEAGIKASASAPVAEGSQEGPSKEEEQTEFKINLISAGPQKMMVIKKMKEFTGKSLIEAKKAVDAGGVIFEKLSKEDSERFAKELKDLQAEVKVE